MSTSEPPLVGDGPRVDLGGPGGTWSVDLVVDGRATAVRGELIQFASPSPWPWWAVIAVVAAAAALGAWCRRARRPISLPPERRRHRRRCGWRHRHRLGGVAQHPGGDPIPFAVPLLGLAAAVLAAVLGAGRRLAPLGAAAAALLLDWLPPQRDRRAPAARRRRNVARLRSSRRA